MGSLSLSAIILSGAIQWYQIMQTKIQQQKNVVQSLDDMHVTLQFMLRDIRNAGYRGCRSLDESFPLYSVYYHNELPYQFFRFDKALHAFKALPGTCFNQLPDDACKRMKHDSMVLILYNIPKKINILKKAMRDPTSDVLIEGKSEIWCNSLALITDCKQGDLFIATQIIPGKESDSIIQHENLALKNKSSAFSKAYNIDAEISELQTVAYYVGVSKIENKTNNRSGVRQAEKSEKNEEIVKTEKTGFNNELKPSYALFRHDFIHHADEIVSDIVYLGIELGWLNPKTHSINYKDPELMDEEAWKTVKTVRITLHDKYYRIWNYEIALRNGNGFNIGSYSINWPFLIDGPYI